MTTSRTLAAVGALAWTTLLEGVRGRILSIAMAASLVVLALAASAATVSYGDRARIIIDVGLLASSLVGFIVVLAGAATYVAGDLRGRSATMILARPIPRWGYLLGRFFGCVAIAIVSALLLAAVTRLTLALFDVEPTRPFAWAIVCEGLAILVGASVAFTFATFGSPVSATLYATMVIIAGRFSGDVLALSDRLAETEGLDAVAGFLRVAFYVIPNLERLSLSVEAANDLPIPGSLYGFAPGYAFAYATSALLVGSLILSRRRTI